MARLKLAYIGGGSTRAPGTISSMIHQGKNFEGSEIVLIDLDPSHLQTVQRLGTRLAESRGIDITIRSTTDRREGLADADAVLSSFRPGGFEARYLDESIPLRHGVIGQETQGPGGFFMALRSIVVMAEIVGDIEQKCPNAVLFNYTNPVNIVSEAVTHHSAVSIVSLCEGPLYFPRMVVRAAGLDPKRLDAVMIGLNHACWSVRHLYDGEDLMPILRRGYEEQRRMRPETDLRMVELALAMESIPSDYMRYYYYREQVLLEMQNNPTTRAQDIMACTPSYWDHYEAVADSQYPQLDPARSRGGLNELELALDVMDAMFNDRGEVWPVNVPNRGTIPGFADDRVVEVPARIDRAGVAPLPQAALPRHVVGLVGMLAEYQALAAEAAWTGTRQDAIRALAANPLVLSTRKAAALYDDMSAAMDQHLPPRLLR